MHQYAAQPPACCSLTKHPNTYIKRARTCRKHAHMRNAPAVMTVCVYVSHTHTHTHVHIHWHTQTGGCRGKKTHSPWSPEDQQQDGLRLLLLSLVAFSFSPLLPLFFCRHSGVSPRLEGERKKTHTHTCCFHEYPWLYQLPSLPFSPLPLPCLSGLPQPPPLPPPPPRRSPSSLLSLLLHRRTVCPLIPYNTLRSSPPLSIGTPVYFYFFHLISSHTLFLCFNSQFHRSPSHTPMTQGTFLLEQTTHIKKKTTHRSQ